MTTDHDPGKKRRYSRAWWIVAVVVTVIVGSFALMRFSLKSAVESRLDEIRAAGYPATCAELDAWYSIPPDAENAADAILDAIASFQPWARQDTNGIPFVGTRHPQSRAETMTEPAKEAAAEYLADNAETLDLLRQASRISHCRFPVDYSAGMNTTINYLSDLRKCFLLIALEAAYHSQNDQPDAAVASINTGLKLAQCLDKEPALISHLVRIACLVNLMNALEYTVNQVEFSDQYLKDLSDSIEDANNPEAMLYSFVGERCMGIDIISAPTRQQIQLYGGTPSPLMVLYTAIGLADQDALVYLDIMAKYIETSKMPLIERTKAAEAVADEVGEIPKIRYWARLMTPALSRFVAGDCRITAHLDTARVALTVERFRLANAELPESLDDLVPDLLESVPVDPFDGKPLKYRRLDTGFVVYSVGEDEQDDGGKEIDSEGRGPEDITFIIGR